MSEKTENPPEFTFSSIYEHVPSSKEGYPSMLYQIKVGQTFKSGSFNKSRIYFTETTLDKDSLKCSRVLKYSDVDWRNSDNELEHFPLLDHSDLNHEITEKEKLSNERARMSDTGVTDYHLSRSSTDLMILGNGNLISIKNQFNEETDVKKVNLSKSPSKILMCHANSSFIAYVSESNVFIAKPDKEFQLQITDNDEENSINIFSGMPSFIMQEEFDRYIGIWWSPVVTKNNGQETIQLLYETVDQTDVDSVSLSSVGFKDKCEVMKYPRPGRNNAISKLSIVSFNVQTLQMVKTLNWDQFKLKNCHELEYLVRAGWTPDGTHVWVEFLNRLQTELSIFLVPLEAFCEVQSSDENISKPIVRIIHETVSNDSWIAVHNYLEFIGPIEYSDSTAKVKFLFASSVNSELGNLVGYYNETKWKIKSNGEYTLDTFLEGEHSRLFHVSPTNGNLLDSSEFYYNPKDQVVYANGFFQHPIVLSVMACNLTKKETYQITRVQTNNYIPERLSYELVAMQPDDNIFVIKSSSMVRTFAVEVFRLKDNQPEKIRRIGVLSTSKSLEQIDEARSAKSRLNYLKFPQYFEKEGHRALLFLPTKEQRFIKKNSDQKFYPTIHFVYAGPGVCLVNSIFSKNIIARAQLLTHFGFAVFMCDTAGCSNTGMDEQKKIKNKFGITEIQDQMDMLSYVASKTEGIDLDRIGVLGASYGGYYSLHAACRFCPSFYKFCVAACPVVDWKFYDTGYTERFIGLPDQRKDDPYFLGSVLSYVHGMDRTKPRLMICHGGQDDNVHFYHTSRLILDLARKGIPYDFQFYPTSKHGFKEDDHYMASVIYFFIKNLTTA